MNKTYLKVLKELNWPPVFLVSPEHFENVEGDKIHGSDGIASNDFSVITIGKGLRGRKLVNTLAHEIFHILFSSRPHWWIETAAERYANGGGRGYWSGKFDKTLDDVPSRKEIVRLARLSGNRLKSKVKLSRKSNPKT